MIQRCQWASGDPWLLEYHDQVWGMPSRDDRFLFEMLALSIFQAGLSWKQVWMKREAFREVFADYRLNQLAEFGVDELEELLNNPRIIRNRAKLSAVLHNARVASQLQEEFGALSNALWIFAGNRPWINKRTDQDEIPNQSPQSHQFSAALKKTGMKFIGPVIAHAYMQSVGMIIDHATNCFRYREIIETIKIQPDWNHAIDN